MRHNTNSGYIMVLALLIISMAMVIASYIGRRGSYYLPFSYMIADREKAKMVALGGVQVAIAQLSQVPKKDQKKETSEKESKQNSSSDVSAGALAKADTQEKDLLTRILPTINRWQHFDLKEDIDGIDGKISLCLMCEEGKINLNQIIDFKKGVFKGNDQSGWKAAMQEICKAIERVNKGSELFAAFEKIVKEVKVPFNDATELVTRKEFNSFKDTMFYQPPTAKKQDTIYLTDIFTVWSSSDKLEPWLFSDSINGLFGLPRVEVDDIKKRKEQTENWLKNFKEKANWQQDWQTILMPMYGKELRTLPKNIDSVLKPTFAPQYFSVLVDGKVDDVTQRVYAIVKRTKRAQGENIEYDVEIIKLYWL